MNKLTRIIRQGQPVQHADGTRHISIVELEPGDCRWPVNDDMSRAEYCGLPQCEGSAAYCVRHYRMAYVKASAPRRVFVR